MKFAVLGRSEILYDAAILLLNSGHDITSVISPKEAPEYEKSSENFRGLAKQNSVPFSSKTPPSEISEILSSGSPEIGVSMNFPYVISEEVLRIFPHGVLNIHGGDLPRYRGNACQAWAILNGEDKIGLCVHKMVPGELDSGDIISRDYLPIDISTSITDVHHWMRTKSPSLMLAALTALESRPGFVLEVQKDSGKLPLRCFPRRPEDGRIDWTQPADRVLRLIKASSKPYRGAYCYFRETELTIWDAEIGHTPHDFLAVPGTVLSGKSGPLLVACGEGLLEIKKYELASEEPPDKLTLRSVRSRLT